MLSFLLTTMDLQESLICSDQGNQKALHSGELFDCYKKVFKMDRPLDGRFLGLTAFQAEGCGIALGHTFGVKVLKMDRPLAGGFLSLTAFQAEGCGLPVGQCL